MYGLDMWGYPLTYSSSEEEESDSMILDEEEEEEERDIIMKEEEEEEEEEDYINDNEKEEEEVYEEEDDNNFLKRDDEGEEGEERANQAASIEKLEAIARKYEEIRRVIEREIGLDREKVLALAVRDVLKHQDVDILEISKLHTKALSQVEYLVRLLEELDGILSYGDEAIRQQRKDINRKIQQMLAFSDKVVKKQEKLKTFIEELREKNKTRQARKKSRLSPPPPPQRITEKQERIQEEEPDSLFEPKHKIIDGVRASIIRVLLPEDHHDLSINLNRQSELQISCGQFKEPLVFQIDSRRVNINHITYKIVHNNILELTLPKMFRRGDYEMFRRRRQPHYGLHPFLM